MKLHLRDKVLDLSTPQIMAVLNATPDSFSDGGQFNSVDVAVNRIEQMVEQGAAIIDIGGESTRPGSEPVSEQQELDRVLPILEKAVLRYSDTLFSIDTTRFKVAKKALELGVHWVNDVSGLQREPRFAELCADYNTGYILMHSLWPPKTMQDDPQYDDIIAEIKAFFERQLEKIAKTGLKTVILDPGIGFGKIYRHNLSILNNIESFLELGYPVMIGASRKATIGKILNDRPVDDRVTGTVAAHYHALQQGANLIRVHDVKEANDSILVYNALS